GNEHNDVLPAGYLPKTWAAIDLITVERQVDAPERKMEQKDLMRLYVREHVKNDRTLKGTAWSAADRPLTKVFYRSPPLPDTCRFLVYIPANPANCRRRRADVTDRLIPDLPFKPLFHFCRCFGRVGIVL